MELPEHYKKLQRVTIYLNKFEKTMAEIEASRLGVPLAVLGRQAVNEYVLASQKKATPMDEAMAVAGVEEVKT